MHSHFHVKPNLEHFEQLLISKLMLTKPSLAEVGTMAELGNIVATSCLAVIDVWVNKSVSSLIRQTKKVIPVVLYEFESSHYTV